jgi:hypothetical protein
MPSTHMICEVIFAAEASGAATGSAGAIRFIAEQHAGSSAVEFVDVAIVAHKVTLGGETPRIVTSINCASIRSFVFIHVLAGYV